MRIAQTSSGWQERFWRLNVAHTVLYHKDHKEHWYCGVSPFYAYKMVILKNDILWYSYTILPYLAAKCLNNFNILFEIFTSWKRTLEIKVDRVDKIICIASYGNTCNS